MEVLKLSCGGVPIFRFSDSTTKLPPPTTSRRDPPLLPLKTRSDLYSFGVTFRIYSSSVYAFPLPARAILSPFFRNRCMPEEVTQIENSEDRNTPSDDNALEESNKSPDKNIEVVKVPTTKASTVKLERIIARVDGEPSQGLPPPSFLYLMDLGLDPDQINTMIRGCPSLASSEVKIKTLVEFLLDLGASRSNVCRILYGCPNMCCYRIEENIIPKMAFLESLGVVNKSDIVKIMCRCPRLFCFRVQNLKETVNYFVELGVPAEKMNKILLRFPQIFGLRIENLKDTVNYFVELGAPAEKMNKILLSQPQIFGLSFENLKDTVNYLVELGVPVGKIGKILIRAPPVFGLSLEKIAATVNYFVELGVPAEKMNKILLSSPKIFGSSIEKKLMPATEFLLDRGFTKNDIATMILNFGALYQYSLEENLMPKWEYFLQMHYQRSDLVSFPQYFSYSLEGRIKPRYNCVKKYGASFTLNYLLAITEDDFKRALEYKLKVDC